MEYSVSRTCEVHLGYFWEKGKGKREKGKRLYLTTLTIAINTSFDF
jgi:hypothetical protein